jgi:membrane protein required for colicin V production
MSGLDYLLLTVIGISVVFGMLRRVALNTVTVLGWLVALVLALRYSREAALALKPLLTERLTAESIGFVAILLMVLGFFVLIGWFLDDLADKVELTLMDRLFGFFVGLGRGVLMVILATVVTFYFVVPTSQMVVQSLLFPYCVQGMEWLGNQLAFGSELAAYLVERRLEFP